jgi:hypothetical protein
VSANAPVGTSKKEPPHGSGPWKVITFDVST